MTTTLPATRDAAAPPAVVEAPAEPVVEMHVRRWGAVTLGAALGSAGVALVMAGLVGAALVLRRTAAEWPPEGVPLDLYRGNMIWLTALFPAAFAQWSRYAAAHDDQRNTAVGLGLTAGIGIALANLVWYVLAEAGFGVGDHAYGVAFYALHGTYLALVLVGVAATLLAMARAIGGQFSVASHQMVTGVAALWASLAVSGFFVSYVIWILK